MRGRGGTVLSKTQLSCVCKDQHTQAQSLLQRNHSNLITKLLRRQYYDVVYINLLSWDLEAEGKEEGKDGKSNEVIL